MSQVGRGRVRLSASDMQLLGSQLPVTFQAAAKLATAVLLPATATTVEGCVCGEGSFSRVETQLIDEEKPSCLCFLLPDVTML